METMIETGIDKWLSALTGVSEESKKQFKAGIQVFTANLPKSTLICSIRVFWASARSASAAPDFV